VPKILAYLRSLGATAKLSVSQLRLKAIVLLSLCAFCTPSDTACIPVPTLGLAHDPANGGSEESTVARFRLSSISWLDGGMEVLWYGSKADKGMSANPVLIESSVNDQVCPVATLKMYVDKTQQARMTVPAKQVFLSLRSPYKGLSSASIAKILTQVLKDSGHGPGVTARSFRPTGARTAIGNNVEPSIVQRRGRWKSSDVFNRHYAAVTGPVTDAVLLQ